MLIKKPGIYPLSLIKGTKLKRKDSSRFILISSSADKFISLGLLIITFEM